MRPADVVARRPTATRTTGEEPGCPPPGRNDEGDRCAWPSDVARNWSERVSCAGSRSSDRRRPAHRTPIGRSSDRWPEHSERRAVPADNDHGSFDVPVACCRPMSLDDQFASRVRSLGHVRSLSRALGSRQRAAGDRAGPGPCKGPPFVEGAGGQGAAVGRDQWTPVRSSETSQRRRASSRLWDAALDSTTTGWPRRPLRPSGL